MKTSNLAADDFDLDGSTPEPAIRSGDTGQQIPCFDSCQLITTLMCNQWTQKVARKCESKHWYACGADRRSGGRSVYGHVITKFSWMGGLPHFLTHGQGGGGGGGLATAFDLAAFRLSMIAPVKKSVNHSRTVASMRETGWEQQQHQEVRLRSDSTV